MKKVLFLSLLASSLVVAVLFTGCEGWTTSDADFNSSQGAGATINFSGYYKGLNGGRAVQTTSAGNIVTLTIQQAGDSVEVRDNQGSVYRGKIGSPGAVSPTSSGDGYSAGAELVQAQINFSGHDNVAAKSINFAGVLHAVAIEDIVSSSSSDEGSVITTESYSDNTNRVVTTTETVGTPADAFYRVTVTTVKYDVKTGAEVSRTVKTSGSTKYSITEANTQYRLQGTWVEEGGVVSGVDAISPASAGLITTTTTATQ